MSQRLKEDSRLVVVGAGEMGRMALRMLLRQLPRARFAVVDRAPENLERALALDPARIAAARRDVAQEPPELRGASAVLNFAGPFYGGSRAVAEAAIAAGCTYLDICDDVEGAQAILELDGDARAAGVALLTGAGNSPGVSNLMAKQLLAWFPETDGIRVVWVVRDADPGGLAPLRHMLHMAVAPCPVWHEGRLITTPGFVPETRREHVLPKIGRVTAFDTAHPEPLTLGREYPELRHVSVQGALLPAWANEAFSILGRLGFGYPDLTVSVNGVEVSPDEVLWKLLWARHQRRHSGSYRQGMTCVQVQALRNEDLVATMTIYDDHSMARSTGLGACAAALAALETPPPPGAWGTEVLDAERTLAIVTRLAEAEGALPLGILTEEVVLARPRHE